ncbi:MAG TPA: cyclase family protein [Phototrophicaceae bacterium]|jgi:arylformamidase|nr:cyclase family protein [Phototrophicaceae bacterium]
MIYDITRTVSPALVVWPGDTPFTVKKLLDLDSGNSVNLTTLTTTPHLGTHADAYYHFTRDGAHPAKMPLNAYLGRVKVVTVTRRDSALVPDDFASVDLTSTERLLIHSHVSDLPDTHWAEEFPYLSVELIEWLAGMGVRLIGLDSPSVDAFDSTALPCHHALKKHNIVNLESVYLHDVPDGDYELIALPLKLDLACGSPVRAILRTI